MTEPSLVDLLEEIALGSVAVTTSALERVGADALSVEQWRAIVILGEAKEGMQISAVARAVGVTLPATSRLLQGLGRHGLVAFHRDPGDARATIARLAPEGLSLRHAALAERRRQLAEIAVSVDLTLDEQRIVGLLAGAFRSLLLSQRPDHSYGADTTDKSNSLSGTERHSED